MPTTDDQTAKRRPFHETIVDAIGRVDSFDELKLLARLIKATKIPKGHDEIIAAWNQHLEGHHFEIEDSDISGVVTDLLKQKQEVAEKEGEKTKEQTGTDPTS